jgi:hypothetical protein
VVNVLKKTLEGTTTLTSSSDDTSVKLYQKKEFVSGGSTYAGYKESDWEIEFAQNHTTPIHFVLASGGELGEPISGEYKEFTSTITWDEEVVEFTRDGSGLICVEPGTGQKIDYSDSQWEAIKSHGINGNTPGSLLSNHNGAWKNFTASDVSNLRIGNSIYIEC